MTLAEKVSLLSAVIGIVTGSLFLWKHLHHIIKPFIFFVIIVLVGGVVVFNLPIDEKYREYGLVGVVFFAMFISTEL